MFTGLELTAFVLAVFPLVISGLEHYGAGCQSMKEWVRFRAEFALFMNALHRQKVFFRQNIEDLLSTVVESEHSMARMLNDSKDEGWKDPKLEARLRLRMSGKHEYECYMATVSSICEVLEKLKRKLRITDDQPPWSQKIGIGFGRLEFEFRRFAYTFNKNSRLRLMGQLEKYNDEIQKLLGNSDKLEPMRRKRRHMLPRILERFRIQASSFHAAVTKALLCECKLPHSTSLLLSREEKGFSTAPPTFDSSEPLKLSIYFSLTSRTWSSARTLVKLKGKLSASKPWTTH
ncbi:MAG: hypothetical protein M1816_002139 [Peltula sp. TS41687]|nr:MAG: hypothetical protein M1816_002139 [Peltula sp. TS41687]